MSQPLVCLASRSPRRAELLSQIGVSFVATPVDIEEIPRQGEVAAQFVERMARAKAEAAVATVATPVLAADTVVVIDDTILGKPSGEDAALAMLTKLSGRTHRVLTAVTVLGGTREGHCLSESRVRLRDIAAHEMRTYWQSGEPCDKAGAYAIQGLGAVFVEHIEGSFSGVMGLPLAQTAALLSASGVPLWFAAGRA